MIHQQTVASGLDVHLNFNADEFRRRDERLNELKEVVRRMGHDFKNLLVPQLGYGSLISHQLAADNPALVFAKKLEGAAQSADQLLDVVLLAARPQRGFSAVATNSFGVWLSQAVEKWKEQLPADSKVRVEQRLEEAISVTGDEKQWRLVVGHLLDNAMQAMPEGGVIRCALQRVTLTKVEQGTLGLAGGQEAALFVVKDTGTGMKPEVLQHCLDPFFSTRGKGLGKGLGLTLVHGVVRLHGGQIWVQSSEGCGTEVRIWLPVNAGEAPTSAKP